MSVIWLKKIIEELYVKRQEPTIISFVIINQ
jgi:hypothetical protein